MRRATWARRVVSRCGARASMMEKPSKARGSLARANAQRAAGGATARSREGPTSNVSDGGGTRILSHSDAHLSPGVSPQEDETTASFSARWCCRIAHPTEQLRVVV